MAIIKELNTKFGVDASYHRVTAFNISYIKKKVVICVASYISKETRANNNEAVEEVDIEVPNDDFTYFLNVNPIAQAYEWLKENVIGFDNAIDDMDVVEPLIPEQIEEEEPSE
ncbi:MAG: hypothetical protein WC154_00300 [Candidatus Izemoplasmatales bacterium]